MRPSEGIRAEPPKRLSQVPRQGRFCRNRSWAESGVDDAPQSPCLASRTWWAGLRFANAPLEPASSLCPSPAILLIIFQRGICSRSNITNRCAGQRLGER